MVFLAGSDSVPAAVPAVPAGAEGVLPVRGAAVPVVPGCCVAFPPPYAAPCTERIAWAKLGVSRRIMRACPAYSLSAYMVVRSGIASPRIG